MNKKIDISNVKSVIRGIASVPMFIEKNEALKLLLKYDAYLGGINQVNSLEREIQRNEAINQVKFYSASSGNIQVGKFSQDFTNVPEGSIALVPVMGAMMRDSYCTLSDGFISGTRDLENTVKMLDNNANVDAMVFYINTPGGEARGNESLSRVIKGTKKPTLGFFEGMASAGVYSFQGLDELYASERSSYWGSIGTYVTLIDDRQFWKSAGVEILEVYAPQSTEKNREFREALNGNLEPLENTLEKMTDQFIKDVKNSRPQLVDDGQVFKGKLYNAEEAKKIGAIDGIKSLDFVLERASFLSRKYKRDKKKKSTRNESEFLNQNDTIMSAEDSKKVGFFDRIFGSNKNTEEAEQEITKVEEKATELSNQVESLTEELSATKTNLEAVNTAFAELTQEKETLSEELNITTVDLETEKIKTENLSQEVETLKTQLSELQENYQKVVEHNKELGASMPSATPIDNEQNTSHEISVANISKERTYEDIIAEMNQDKK